MSINMACKLLGKARSTFFEVRKNLANKAKREQLVEQYILEKVNHFRQDMPRIGGKKLFYLINQNKQPKQFKFGQKKFFDVLRKYDLLVKKRKKHVFTTDSRHWRNQFDNLVEGISINRPEQVWVADITYFKTRSSYLYGHLITDAYSKKLMGVVVSDNMKATTTLLALQKAIQNRQYNDTLIHHSDRGFQYLSRVYTNHLKKHDIKISVTQNGSPYDNPVAERINGILKSEFGLGNCLKNLEEAQLLLEKAMHIYNHKRPHWSNHLLTPNQMHNQNELKPISWEFNPKDDL